MPKPPSPISPLISTSPTRVPSGKVWLIIDELDTNRGIAVERAVAPTSVRWSSSGTGRDIVERAGGIVGAVLSRYRLSAHVTFVRSGEPCAACAVRAAGPAVKPV